jgi:hypothetical protein
MAKRTNIIEELTTTGFCYFDFANGDVEVQVGTDKADSDFDVLRAPIAQANHRANGSNATCFTDSSNIIWVAAELDAWALDNMQWFATNMAQLLIQHLPECIAWIPFAIDSLQREQEKQRKQNQRASQEDDDWENDKAKAARVRSVPFHPGVLWSTEL